MTDLAILSKYFSFVFSQLPMIVCIVGCFSIITKLDSSLKSAKRYAVIGLSIALSMIVLLPLSQSFIQSIIIPIIESKNWQKVSTVGNVYLLQSFFFSCLRGASYLMMCLAITSLAKNQTRQLF